MGKSNQEELTEAREIEIAFIRHALPVGFPKIVCLCGSTRFFSEYADANFRETLAGNIVLSVGCYREGYGPCNVQLFAPDESEKEALDRLHFRKIELADEILVINVGGYIGESTSREIAYATRLGKPVRYLIPG